jgi:hypothetical protein
MAYPHVGELEGAPLKKHPPSPREYAGRRGQGDEGIEFMTGR